MGRSSADKGQVWSPSAALMGRAAADPSPVENQLGQSIVSNRVPACLPAFRVTSPSVQRAGRAAGLFFSTSPEKNMPSKGAIMQSNCFLTTWHTAFHLYLHFISLRTSTQVPPTRAKAMCPLPKTWREKNLKHGEQHCSNIVQPITDIFGRFQRLIHPHSAHSRQNQHLDYNSESKLVSQMPPKNGWF